MGEIVDIRSAGRFPGKRIRGAEKSRGQSEKRDDENGQKKQKRERPLPSFLPFCPQIGIGKHFDIILGIEIAGEFSIGATAQRVIEASAGVLEISQYVLSESLPEQSLTREGDLLLTIGHHEIQSPKLLATILGSQKKFPSEPKQAKVNEQLCVRQPIRKVDSDLKGCLIGIDVIALRPKNNSVSSDDLLQFFRLSDLSLFQPWEWLSRATTAKSRSKVVDSLSDLSVPVIPREVTEVLEESAAAYEELSHDDFDVAGLLGSRNRNEFDKRLLRLRAGQHVLREAVQASNSLPYLIKTFYPFPIAFPYRSLSAVRNQALFDEFRVAEGLLAFIGSLALALSRPASSDLLKAFADFYNFSVGVWLKLGGIASKVLRSAAGSDLPDGLRLLFNGSFAEKADKLVNLRNHYFHGRNR